MCVILDANCFGNFENLSNEEMQPVRDWLRRSGKIVYSDTNKFREEWERGGMKARMTELSQAGKLKLVSAQDVQQKADELKGRIESDDEHIIALAMVANAKVLIVGYNPITQRGADRKLHRDFKNRNLVGGKVYQRARHKHLLTRDTCP